MMSDMAVFTQSLTICGVEDERKQFRDLSAVMGVFARLAATLTKAVGIRQYGTTPFSPTWIGLQALPNDVDDSAHAVALPIRVIRATEILAHPLTLAGGGNKRYLYGQRARTGTAGSLFRIGRRCILPLCVCDGGSGGRRHCMFAEGDLLGQSVFYV